MQVRRGIYWALRTYLSEKYPNADRVVYKICAHKPPKTVLLQMLRAEAHPRRLLLGIDANHEPDADWIIIAIATLNPDHELFGKGYRPPIARGVGGPGGGVLISNRDDFFTGLPVLTSYKDLKIKSVSCLSKEDRLAGKLARNKPKSRKPMKRSTCYLLKLKKSRKSTTGLNIDLTWPKKMSGCVTCTKKSVELSKH